MDVIMAASAYGEEGGHVVQIGPAAFLVVDILGPIVAADLADGVGLLEVLGEGGVDG